MLQLFYMQELTNMTTGIRDARTPASPSKNKCKNAGIILFFSEQDYLKMCRCFLYVCIPCYASVLDGFLGKGSPAHLDEHRIKL